jgi:hypothetical protein
MALLTDSAASLEIVLVDEGPRDPVDPDMDLCWLDLQCNVRTPDRQWSFTDPMLTVGELFRLADFLKAWADLPLAEDDWDFMEPNFKVRKLPKEGPRIHLQFGFDYESHPDRHNQAGDPYWMSFEVEPASLRRFADELMVSLRKRHPNIAWGERNRHKNFPLPGR